MMMTIKMITTATTTTTPMTIEKKMCTFFLYIYTCFVCVGIATVFVFIVVVFVPHGQVIYKAFFFLIFKP